MNAPPHAPAPDAPEPPGLAIVTNVPTPYRVHLHHRIAAGLPQFKLHSLFTHTADDFQWSLSMPPEIHPVSFAAGPEAPNRWRPFFDWRKGARIIQYLHAHNIRAVICHGYYHLTNVRIINHCRRRRIPVFLSADSNIRNDHAAPGLRQLAKKWAVGYVVRHCNGILPIGTCCQQFYERYGADPRKCFWVPFEPDYDFFSAIPPAELAEFRRRHSLQPDRRHLLFSGRLISLKRIDLLLQAFSQIAPQRPSWDLTIVGDGPLLHTLQAQVPANLTARVHWLGFLDVQHMRAAYHASDVLLLPSNKEAWGMVVNEALAAGLPIVISDRPGAAADLVRDGVNGRVFPCDDLAALTQALLDATDDQLHQRYRRAVPGVLADWRQRADPVLGLRRALASVGLLPPPPENAAAPRSV